MITINIKYSRNLCIVYRNFFLVSYNNKYLYLLNILGKFTLHISTNILLVIIVHKIILKLLQLAMRCKYNKILYNFNFQSQSQNYYCN